MKDRFDVLVFDWDGTLFDSIHWIVECLQFAATECGLPVPSDRSARSVIGLSLERAFQALFPHASADEIEPMMAAYHQHYDSKIMGPDDLFDGVADMIAELRACGYQLAVATGKTRLGLDHALHATGAVDWFHATRCAGETASKPDPLMLLQIMRQLGSSSHRTLLIGDSVHDLQMAKNVGIESVAVYCGADGRDELLAFTPLLGLDHTAQLLDYLR
jgi:phosphoglycolate phosphatase